MLSRKRARFDQASGGLRPATLRREIVARRGEVARLAGATFAGDGAAVAAGCRMRCSSRRGCFSRFPMSAFWRAGFALVTRADGALVRSAAVVADGDALRLRFADGEVAATAGAKGPIAPRPETAPDQPQRPRIRRRARSEDDQGNLF